MDNKVNIGRIPIMKGEYTEGVAYKKLWQVTYLGSTYQSKIENNTSAPAQIVDGIVSHANTDKWLCIADATNVVNATVRIDELEEVKYEKPSNGIPSSDLSNDVNNSLTLAETAYQKPTDGIPKTDLDSSVQASLDKADSSIQYETIETIGYDGSVDGQPVAQLRQVLTKEINDRQEAVNNESIQRQNADENLLSKINQKQDIISDLTTIRSNAEAGKALVGKVSYYTTISEI